MSIHRSLRTKSALARSRNVLTRVERIAILSKSGRWDVATQGPFGLPKVRIARVKKRSKPKKEAAAAAEPAAK